MIRCTDPSTGTNGYCLYTSVDMGQDFAYPGNYYPMEETKLYYSTNGYSSWVDKGEIFHEDTLENAGWVPSDAYHLWAPSAIKDGSTYYFFVPDVENISDDLGDEENIHNSSRIAVATATNPLGPYTYQGVVEDTGFYMSDPDAIINGTDRYLFWANGDMSTCGGFSSAVMESDWRSIVDLRSVAPVTVNGVEVLGNCIREGESVGVGRPYMEGASLYGSGNTWTMYFAAKPDDGPDSGTGDDIPKECKTAVGGPDSTNSVIAWATASSPAGPYTYKGVLMCGSTTEWTNQATVATASNGRKFVVYHDAGNGVDAKQRNLHAECLWTNGTLTATVYKQAANVTNGFNDCMNGTNAAFWVYTWTTLTTACRRSSGRTAATAP
jgi:hypothetical protein